MISSIQKKKLHKCNGNLSLHVLNIIDAIHNSAKKGKKVKAQKYIVNNRGRTYIQKAIVRKSLKLIKDLI